MGYYHTCPYCGANLDPGERCDCMKLRERYPPLFDMNHMPLKDRRGWTFFPADSTRERGVDIP